MLWTALSVLGFFLLALAAGYILNRTLKGRETLDQSTGSDSVITIAPMFVAVLLILLLSGLCTLIFYKSLTHLFGVTDFTSTIFASIFGRASVAELSNLTVEQLVTNIILIVLSAVFFVLSSLFLLTVGSSKSMDSTLLQNRTGAMGAQRKAAERAIESRITSSPYGTTNFYTIGLKMPGLNPNSDISDLPMEGLNADWVITSRNVTFLSNSPQIQIQLTRTRSSTVSSARFSLYIPQYGPTDSIDLSLQLHKPDYGELDLTIYNKAAIYRSFSILLRRSNPVFGTPKTEVKSTLDQIISPIVAELPDWAHPPGRLSISVHHDAVDVKGDLRSEAVNTTTDWYCVARIAEGRIESVRSALDVFRSRWEDYLNNIDPNTLRYDISHPPFKNWQSRPPSVDKHHEEQWREVAVSLELHELCQTGHLLYEAFFPTGSPLRGWLDSLEPGHRIDITWRRQRNLESWIPNVPWGLMYMGVPPQAGEPVDPTYFAALRFRLDYTGYDDAKASQYLSSVKQCYSGYCLYWGDEKTDEASFEAQWQRQQWSQNNHIFVPDDDQRRPKSQLKKFLNEPSPRPMPILYIYCRSTIGKGNAPVLQFDGAGDTLTLTELGSKPLLDRPLMFVNACGTIGAKPYFANELVTRFFERGCRAYIGTECRVPIQLASRFAWLFFHLFRDNVDRVPIAVGEAVTQSRQFLWRRYYNIGGLLYSHINRYDLFFSTND